MSNHVDIDPYIVLGIATDASLDEIKNAYRRIARRLHPDVNRFSPGAAVQFQDITVAHELLMDEQRRAAYDRTSIQRRKQDEMQFSLRITPSKRTVARLDEPQVVYLLAEILSDPRTRQSIPQKREANVNLALVLDHSKSMSGSRLDKVKIAAHQIIDQLTEADILTVVGFNDRPEVIIPATPVRDKAALKATVSMMVASGGTEIYRGLRAGVEQVQRYLAPRLVNHIILLTDGKTYGDHDDCIALAKQAAQQGIGISAMGLGEEWNDEFLDELAGTTGGASTYIRSASAVVKFLNDHVRNLSDAFAERMRISIACDSDVQLESVFKLSPQPQPLSVDDGYIQLGSLQANRMISVLFQLQLPAHLKGGFRPVARVLVSGDILENEHQRYMTLSDVSLEAMDNPGVEDPPIAILDALGKLTLYRMQERAQQALESGNVEEATRRLEHLATRLLAMGEPELASEAKSEANRVRHTRAFSDEGRKSLKYQTRHLLAETVSSDT